MDQTHTLIHYLMSDESDRDSEADNGSTTTIQQLCDRKNDQKYGKEEKATVLKLLH